MSMKATPHINLRGNARQALEFYQSVFGGHLVLVTYREMGNVQDPAEADHIVWGQVASDAGFQVMAYDVPRATAWQQGENAFFVSVRGESADEITACWTKLSRDATIVQPLAPSAWSSLYGMLRDPFGVTWILDVASAQTW